MENRIILFLSSSKDWGNKTSLSPEKEKECRTNSQTYTTQSISFRLLR